MLNIELIFGIILYLSSFDRQLSTRTDHKAAEASISTNASQFVSKMESVHENGEHFSCGLTRSWVSELFEGLEGQYEEFKSIQRNAGYSNYTGDSLIQMFTENFNTTHGWIYNMRHMGTQDHDWVIWQLPEGAGYRILQSYHDAYSLRAWLSPDSKGLFEEEEIILPHDLKHIVDESLKQLSGGALNLSNFEQMKEFLPREQQGLIPFISYVSGVNESVVVEMFERSREKFGGGKILSKNEFFGDYLNKTKKVMDYFEEFDGSEELFSQEIYGIWIELYGSPDPIYFPGLPNNFLSKDLLPGKEYYFESKMIALPESEQVLKQNVVSNGKVLRKALGDE